MPFSELDLTWAQQGHARRVNREGLGRHPRKTWACELLVWQGLGSVIFSIWSVCPFLARFWLLLTLGALLSTKHEIKALGASNSPILMRNHL
ncbi:hypothetical protein F383_38627 [Gossypium arboreum]|uniref:Uncharacterized protein n=1 Tax=Gossypium arboreum TaxID=29729 RepID=A0A0B0MCG0_GOSAR|nr:hypothetical protein F383_38627 [Gossypium arboreum]